MSLLRTYPGPSWRSSADTRTAPFPASEGPTTTHTAPCEWNSANRPLTSAFKRRAAPRERWRRRRAQAERVQPSKGEKCQVGSCSWDWTPFSPDELEGSVDCVVAF